MGEVSKHIQEVLKKMDGMKTGNTILHFGYRNWKKKGID